MVDLMKVNGGIKTLDEEELQEEYLESLRDSVYPCGDEDAVEYIRSKKCRYDNEYGYKIYQHVTKSNTTR